MTLSPMRFKSFVWPHNPAAYEIEFRRTVVRHKIPRGLYVLQDLGRTGRVMRGEGAFAGEDAYGTFKKLAAVFYENSPGLLVHPVWQTSQAWLTSLTLTQEPAADYVGYAFEFMECAPAYDAGAVLSAAATAIGRTAAAAAGKTLHTVRAGETLWAIAAENELTLAALIALNPQISNPNLIRAGDTVRIG